MLVLLQVWPGFASGLAWFLVCGHKVLLVYVGYGNRLNWFYDF